MASPEHLAILKRGVDRWNRWRQEHPELRSAKIEKRRHDGNISDVILVWTDFDLPPRLGNASYFIGWGVKDDSLYIRAKDLSPPDLSGADLRGAILRGADLSCVNLLRADLHGADLSCADLQFANLRQTDLVGANLTEADLSKADLMEADLSGARIDRTKMLWTMLAYANFTAVDRGSVNLANTHLQGAISAK